jgi:hypothetical protein
MRSEGLSLARARGYCPPTCPAPRTVGEGIPTMRLELPADACGAFRARAAGVAGVEEMSRNGRRTL